MIIQTTHRQFRYVDPMDLLTFCKKDIARLVSKKLEVPPGLDESHTKEWLSQIATMQANNWYADTLFGRKEMDLIVG